MSLLLRAASKMELKSTNIKTEILKSKQNIKCNRGSSSNPLNLSKSLQKALKIQKRTQEMLLINQYLYQRVE